jgi:hypothetical protein
MNHFWRDSRLKRALFGAMLAVYLSASLGILPSPDLLSRWLGHAISEPFPCQSHSCGCATAHQCWTDCCCFTPRQRLAWAMRNRVTPPPSARFSDADRLAAASDVAQDKAPSASDSADCPLCIADTKSKPDDSISCATGCSTASAPHASASDAPSSCCTPAETSSPPLSLDQCPVPPSLPLPSISPLTCKGLKLLLAFALPAAPPLAFNSLLPPPPRLPRHDRPEDDRAPTRKLDTSEPPPRARTFRG